MGIKWLVAIRGRVPLAARIVLGVMPAAAILGVWCMLTLGPVEQRRVSPHILPNPVELFSFERSIGPLFGDRQLLSQAAASLKRVGLSYLLALVVTFPLGVLMGSFSSVRSVFAPTTTVSGYVPISALVPLTMSLVRGDERQKVVFLALAFAIYLLPMIVKAIDNVADVYLRTASTLGASRWQIVRKILVPIAMPDIWHGMRLAFGIGWTYLVLAEAIIMSDGLGYIITTAQRRGPREHIYLVILAITLIAWISDMVWSRLGRALFASRGRAAE